MSEGQREMSTTTTTFKCCGVLRRKYPVDLSPPKEVDDIFNKYSENGLMGAVHLHKFLMEVQGDSKVSVADTEHIINVHLRETAGKLFAKLHRPGFTKENFFNYLFSTILNPAINPAVHHDMTAPMSHYYIYTGHNSYLTGNQLSSDCSEKPIIEALQRGVRVIELDIWPNSTKEKINVLHGGTLTSPVAFQTCITAIKENAFVKSQYPVVITLEDHLTPELQAKAAEIITKTFGDALFYPSTEEALKEFPSPEALKGRILISTKPPKEYLAGKKGKAPEKMEENKGSKQAISAEEEPWGDEIPDIAAELKKSDKNSPEPVEEEDNLDEEDSDVSEKHPDAIVAPEYKRIITIRQAKPKGDSLKDALISTSEHVLRVSLSEPQLVKFAKAYPTDIIRFTQMNLLRIYPYGLRFNSSNYSPLVAWIHGAQMVAFNMQGYGRPLWLVHGFFRANGGCGYVKKPDFLIHKSIGADTIKKSLYDPQVSSTAVKETLRVKVYMGLGWLEKFGKTHFDTFSPPDFYTRIGIAGVPDDSVMKKTNTIEDCWTPHWDTEFQFPLRVPELALLRIEVHEYDMSDKDDFGGQTCLPVSELRPGIRAVPLCDKKGRELVNVRLLLRFEFLPERK